MPGCFNIYLNWIFVLGLGLAKFQNSSGLLESREEYVTTTIPDGTLRGREMLSDGPNPVRYYSFLGIPYAKPPVGELRFKDPQPAQPWEGVKDAIKEGPNSLQKHIFFKHEIGDEDCLYLNVFSRKLSSDPSDLKPVMVYIHAGGFTAGSGDTEIYGPGVLIEHDVILVTFNYRLGALGFLSLGNDKLPGNLGLKDQVFLLEWVQKSIKHFGGDPNCVTIFGISAGGASVEYLLLSPLAKGLFHRAIIQSGSTLNPWAFENDPKNITIRLAKHLNYKDNLEDSDKMFDFFMKVPPIDLMRAQYEILTEKERQHTLILPIRPVVEKEGPGKQFITKSPREILESGDFNQVPVIIGSTSNEGNIQLEIFETNDAEFKKWNDNPELLIPLNMAVPDDKKEEVIQEIQKFYFDGKPISWNNVDQYLEFVGDNTFYLGINDALLSITNKSTKPVYNYQLSYQNKRSIMRFVASTMYPDYQVKGTPHGDDITLLFKQGNSFPKISIPPKDEEIIQVLSTMWINFAKTGNPNYKGINSTWEATKNNNLQYYDIGNEVKMVPGIPCEKRYKFWENLYAKYKHAY